MGGAIATLEAWETLGAEWGHVLRSYGLTAFHMVDFEHGTKDFKRECGWPEDRKRRLLDELLEIIDRHVRAFSARERS